MLDSLLSTFAPHSCCGCGNLGSLLCPICKNDIVSEPFARCIVCLGPAVSSDLCRLCAAQARLDAAWCVGNRGGALKTLLNRYKFDSAVEAGAMGAELLDVVMPMLPPETAVVPVPTAPGRMRVRGFDHTARIARHFAHRRALTYRSVLARTSSQTQHFKSRAERLRTAGETMTIRRHIPEAILLIDDIYTTGATAAACVKLLRKQGAKKVYLAIIARQTLD